MSPDELELVNIAGIVAEAVEAEPVESWVIGDVLASLGWVLNRDLLCRPGHSVDKGCEPILSAHVLFLGCLVRPEESSTIGNTAYHPLAVDSPDFELAMHSPRNSLGRKS